MLANYSLISVANEPNPHQNLKNIEIDSMQNTEIIEDEEFMKNR